MKFSYGYAADRSTPLYADVNSISCSAQKDGSHWEYLLAIHYGRDTYFRERGISETRDGTIKRMASHLIDHFNCIPKMVTLRIERGREQSFSKYLKRIRGYEHFQECEE